jgi:hypothetical protein
MPCLCSALIKLFHVLNQCLAINIYLLYGVVNNQDEKYVLAEWIINEFVESHYEEIPPVRYSVFLCNQFSRDVIQCLCRVYIHGQ